MLFIFISSTAQNTLISAKEKPFETFRIQYVNQFPTIGNQKKITKLSWLARVILGRKSTPKITKPIAILASSPANFSILDQGAATIFTIKENDKRIPKILKKNKFNFPSLVSFCNFTNNEILFTDSRLHKIFKLNEEQKKLEVLNPKIQLQQPTGIAYSKVNNEIWVVETSAHRISVLNKKGKLLRTIGKRGTKPGEFNFPTAIWIDNLGKVYVIDAMNYRVQIFNKDGALISVFGEQGNATGYFARPKGIATDTFGNIYITDALYHTVQVFDISGNYLYQFGEQGRGKGQFWMPSGIYIDNNNYIYVADVYNSRIEIFQLINDE